MTVECLRNKICAKSFANLFLVPEQTATENSIAKLILTAAVTNRRRRLLKNSR
jgi:hypothetical protein